MSSLAYFPRKREVTNEHLSNTLVAGVFWLNGSGLFVTILRVEFQVSPNRHKADPDQQPEKRR